MCKVVKQKPESVQILLLYRELIKRHALNASLPQDLRFAVNSETIIDKWHCNKVIQLAISIMNSSGKCLHFYNIDIAILYICMMYLMKEVQDLRARISQ